jgi:predicted O-methyltransferase YrrM
MEASKTTDVEASVARDEILSPLPQPFRSTLLSIYKGEPQLGSDGEWYSLDGKTAISADEGMWLYNLCREAKPKATLEIGLAYGYSTVYFLASIRENGVGRHSAVDPFQSDWHGIGWCRPRSLSMSDGFRFIEEKSVAALAHLADRGEMFEVIFIDGNHRFDDALVDFTLSAELCPNGGCIILDDMWMTSIRRAVAFIRSNRKDFEEIKTPVSNIAAFRRIGEDTRVWNHYVDFFDPVEFFDIYAKRTKGAIRHFTPALFRRGMKAALRSVGR